jgi:dihydropteroate synthase
LKSLFPSFQTIRFQDRILSLERPAIMGILNITPDSFYEGSRVLDLEVCRERAAGMVALGATFLDVGGHSTRPGAAFVSEQEEIDRVVPVIAMLREAFPKVIISIDTYRLAVAKAGFAAGAHVFNDIGAGQMDEGIFEWVAEAKIPYVLTHSVGKFEDVHDVPNYKQVVEDVWSNLASKLQQLRQLGAEDVFLDPGFGFSKSLEHNYELLAHLENFLLLGAPLLVGLSRKTMIYKELGITAAESLNGTSVLHTIALQKGASVLRVHDVAEAIEVVHLVEKIKQYGISNLV